jgi:hypothetical protein
VLVYWRYTPTEPTPFTPSGVPEMLRDVATDVVVDQISIPPGGTQQTLRLVRSYMSSMLRQPPAVLPADPDNKPVTSAIAAARINTDFIRIGPSIRNAGATKLAKWMTGWVLAV